MHQAPLPSATPLPRWLIAAGSLAIVVHLAAILILILDVPSGPWVGLDRTESGDAPAFVHEASALATVHADYLRLAHSYHDDLMTGRPASIEGVEFDVRLKGKDGKVIATLHFPDPEANRWVRFRQEQLARGLAFDFPYVHQGGEVIPAPGEAVPLVAIWALPGEDFSGMKPPAQPPDRIVPVHLERVLQHRVPRTRPVSRPSDLSLVLAHSYARYLCRTHGAASAEIVRQARPPIPPAVLFGRPTPPAVFEDVTANYGEMSE